MVMEAAPPAGDHAYNVEVRSDHSRVGIDLRFFVVDQYPEAALIIPVTGVHTSESVFHF